MAGVSLEEVVQRTGSRQVIRAMANAAAEIGKSYTPWLVTQEVTDEQKAFAQRLFETFGSADEVFTEQPVELPDGAGRNRACLPGVAGAQPVRSCLEQRPAACYCPAVPRMPWWWMPAS